MTITLEALTETLIGVAEGDFSARAERSFAGDPLDVVAYLLNNLVDELQGLADERAAASLEQGRAEHLAATGRLAAGVAHEVNNPLAHLTLNLEWLESRFQAGDVSAQEALSLVRTSREGVQRISRIVGDLHRFGRPPQDLYLQPVSLDEAVAQAVGLAAPTTREWATVEVQGPSGLFALADADRLGQILINLLMNAAQAFERREPSLNRVVVRAGIESGHVVLRVRDGGIGIPLDMRERVFEPFVTGRRDEGGTGLGLSVSRSLARAMGGDIVVAAPDGPGAEVALRLDLAAAPEASPAPEPILALPTRLPRVLLVDDEEEILNALKRCLRRRAEVEVAENGLAALERMAAGEFDLVLCDLVMPVLDGAEAWQRARAEHPWVKGRWVVMTGAAPASLAQRVPGFEELQVLRKPFALAEVHALLDRFGD